MGEVLLVYFLVWFSCLFKFSRSDTDYFFLVHSLLINKCNIIKCWIASISSHKALVNSEPSYSELICFMVTVRIQSTGLLARSWGLS